MNIVQKPTTISEKSYRNMKNRLSYSSLKDFDKNRLNFYKEYILGEGSKFAPTNDTIIGSLGDCLLFTKDDFDLKFLIATSPKPTGQMGELCDSMINITNKYAIKIDPEDEFSAYEITASFSTIIEEAYQELIRKDKFKGKTFDKVVEMFEKDPDGENYYLEGRNSIGKQLVTISQVTYTEKLIKDALNSPFEAGEILRTITEGNTEVLDQLIILFEIEGTLLRSMLDRVIIDHNTKVIKPYDLKITWESESFDYNFLKMKYYIQLGVYISALKYWIENTRTDLKDYTIEDFCFITLDSTGISSPLVYKSSKEWYIKSMEGFTTSSGRKYKGIKELISEINHHLETGNWFMSKENYENNGVTILKENWL
jgi:hypothetical protein